MKQPHTILIVEDEESIREMVRLTLERERYVVVDCETAEEAHELLAHNSIDLAILDWMLPGMSGVEFAQKLRDSHEYKHLPLMLLTAKAEEDDKIHGFNAGIDDYLCKPFSLKELLARIQSLLRRSQQTTPEVISYDGLNIDTESHLVYTDAKESIHLGPTEFKLLLTLMSHPGRVYSREQLLDKVWGVGVYVDERTVDVHVRRLRKALTPHQCDDKIRTVRGSGYSFKKGI